MRLGNMTGLKKNIYNSLLTGIIAAMGYAFSTEISNALMDDVDRLTSYPHYVNILLVYP